MQGRGPSEHWKYLQVIRSPLYEGAYHSAATVVGMRHAYGIFQAEEVGQYSQPPSLVLI